VGGERATDGTVTSGFIGDVVEVNIAGVARSANYIKFLAATQGGESGPKAVVFGEEEGGKRSGGGSSSYISVIVRSLTVDGWIVICLLAVMSVISIAVMVLKNRYITGALKGNECFLRLFEERVGDDLTVLENAQTHQLASVGGALSEADGAVVSLSPLYRLYHIGAREIRKRIAEEREAHGKKPLSGAAIRAINVSMDAGRARELQKLQKWMVLLTIAISGGPFLGLLGTVVGVMITFAAVAQAGDVNVNAIAPGIAAALLATVAGLAVAIPALFGYNYLLSRLKEVTVDMQVFVDEFIAKVTEFYTKRREKSTIPVGIEV
jgi:biopolymer transport protein ExbB